MHMTMKNWTTSIYFDCWTDAIGLTIETEKFFTEYHLKTRNQKETHP